MYTPEIGAKLAETVKNGADPRTVIPNEFVIVRGGISEMPVPGEMFSGDAGPTLEAAAAAVPHGTIRVSTAGEVRTNGGIVEWEPDLSRYDTLNQQHVNIIESGTSTFSGPRLNPVPREERIDGEKI